MINGAIMDTIMWAWAYIVPNIIVIISLDNIIIPRVAGIERSNMYLVMFFDAAEKLFFLSWVNTGSSTFENAKSDEIVRIKLRPAR